jgi:hypothetical protein
MHVGLLRVLGFLVVRVKVVGVRELVMIVVVGMPRRSVVPFPEHPTTVMVSDVVVVVRMDGLWMGVHWIGLSVA